MQSRVEKEIFPRTTLSMTYREQWKLLWKIVLLRDSYRGSVKQRMSIGGNDCILYRTNSYVEVVSEEASEVRVGDDVTYEASNALNTQTLKQAVSI